MAVCTAFLMTGSVKAQITVNSSKVEISQPISVKNIEAIGSLKLDLGKCGLTFNNWMGPSVEKFLSTTDDIKSTIIINPINYDGWGIYLTYY